MEDSTRLDSNRMRYQASSIVDVFCGILYQGIRNRRTLVRPTARGWVPSLSYKRPFPSFPPMVFIEQKTSKYQKGLATVEKQKMKLPPVPPQPLSHDSKKREKRGKHCKKEENEKENR